MGFGILIALLGMNWLMGHATADVIEHSDENGDRQALEGDETDNFLLGDEDNDALFSGEGNDLIVGGEGDDLIIDVSGADTLNGGEGDDILIAANVVDAPTELQEVLAAKSGETVIIETVRTTDDDALADRLNGEDGNDILTFGAGDTVVGGEGDDRFEGGEWLLNNRHAIVEDFDQKDDSILYFTSDADEVSLSMRAVDGTNDVEVLDRNQHVMTLKSVGSKFSLKDISIVEV